MRRQRTVFGSVVLVLILLGGLTLILTGCGEDRPVNHAPVLSAIGAKSVTEGETLTFTVTASDIDGDDLTLWVNNQPPNSQFSDIVSSSSSIPRISQLSNVVTSAGGGITGTFTFIPNYDQEGTLEPTFVVSDGMAEDSETVAITVTDVAFTHHAGIMTTSETWTAADNPHLVAGDIEIQDGAVLTIESGCIVEFIEGRRIRVGYVSAGGLVATGVTFTASAENPTPGIWDGITFSAYTTNSSLSDCLIEYGGGNGFGNVFVDDGEVAITDCILRLSSSNGIYFQGEGRASDFSGNEISGNLGYPAQVSCNYLGRLGGSNLVGNTKDTLLVGGTEVTSDADWDTLGVPFRLTTMFEVKDGAILNIVPGNVLVFDKGAGIEVGKTSAGFLVADGTVDRPLIFTAADPAAGPGAWAGLYFGPYTDAASSLNNCTVQLGGKEFAGNVEIKDAEISIQNSTIEQSGQSGIYCDGDARFSLFTGNTLKLNSQYPIRIGAQSVGALTDATEYLGNTIDKIAVYGTEVTEDVTWKNLGLDYIVSGTVVVGEGAHMTIAPGDTVYFNTGAGIEIGGTGAATFTADGADDPILFAGADGATWAGLKLLGGTTAASQIRNCTINDVGGSGILGGIHFVDCQAVINSSEISNCSVTGVYFDGAAYALEFEDNLITGNKFPVAINGNYLGFLSANNDFSGNTNDVFQISGSEISATTSWANPGVPLQINNDITIQSGVQLTILPGATLQLADHVNLIVADGGALIADGSTEQITFTASGQRFGSLVFLPGASSASILKNCLIENGGSRTSYDPENAEYPGCVHIDGSTISLIDCTITGSKAQGVYCYGTGYPSTFNGNTITDNQKFPFRVDAGVVHLIGGTNTFTDNDLEVIQVSGLQGDYCGRVTASATWAAQQYPYYIDFRDSLKVVGNTTLTLAPGVEMIFFKRSAFIVGDPGGNASVVAIGTETDSITFTREYDNQNTSTSNNWGGFRLYGAGNDASVFKYCKVLFAGSSTIANYLDGNFHLVDCSPTITNCRIGYSRDYGIYREGTSAPTLTDNVYHNNSKGDLWP